MLSIIKAFISVLAALGFAGMGYVLYHGSGGGVGSPGVGGIHGAPGPVAGVGLPLVAVAYAVYWFGKRRRKTD